MEKYHIGEEIKKEMKKQNLSPGTFAKALYIERQTVYDMFKRTYIATDRLMEISRILNRDFFKEFSDIYTKGEIVNEEEESIIQECISTLMPEDKLHIFKTSQIAEIVDEYFSSSRKKPLVVVCDRRIIQDNRNENEHYDGKDEIPGIFRKSCKDTFGTGMVKAVDGDDIQALNDQIEVLASLPHKVIEIAFCSGEVDNIISFAEKLIEISDKFVIVYWDHTNKLSWKDHSTLECDTQAEDCFEAWHDRIHMFVADNRYNDYSRRQKLCQISQGMPDDDIFFQAEELKMNGNKEEAIAIMTEALNKKIYSLHESTDNSSEDEIWRSLSIKKAFVKVNEFIGSGEEDMGKCIRCHVTNKEQTTEMKELLRYLLIDSEDVGFWYDKSKEDGKIVDWKYSPSSLIRKAWGIDNTYTVKAEIKAPAKVADLIPFMLNNLSSHNFKNNTLTVIVPAESIETYRQCTAFAGMDVEFVADKHE